MGGSACNCSDARPPIQSRLNSWSELIWVEETEPSEGWAESGEDRSEACRYVPDGHAVAREGESVPRGS